MSVSILQTMERRSDGELVLVGCRLGSGGQGDVYEATVAGTQHALKWYHPHCATSMQKTRIMRLVEQGSPSEQFLWPTDIVDGPNLDAFGYLMPLRPPSYRSIVDVVAGRVEVSFRVLATAGVHLVNAFLDLHSRGFCYGDISFGNVFLEPAKGTVLICDNDNVVPDDGREVGVLGTARFMAPEIVRGEALPSSDTDRHSLAVLLFYMLMVGHPLEGEREVAIRCMDLPAMEQLYGWNPIFVFDPQDASNRPAPEVHDHVGTFWELYPENLRAHFTRVFTNGLRDPRARVRESEWRNVLSQLHDALFACRCGADNFYCRSRVRAGGNCGDCWQCGEPLRSPPRMRIGKRIIALSPDTVIHQDRMRPGLGGRGIGIAGRVVEDSKARLILQNFTQDTWNARLPGKPMYTIRPGGSVALEDSLSLHFGQMTAEVRL